MVPNLTPLHFVTHLELHNNNFHNDTHSPISQNPREGMFVVKSHSLLSHFSPLYHKYCHYYKPPKKVNPHPRIAPCVNMWSFFFFFFFWHLLNVGACICHITQEGQLDWNGLMVVTEEQNQIVLTSPLSFRMLVLPKCLCLSIDLSSVVHCNFRRKMADMSLQGHFLICCSPGPL